MRSKQKLKEKQANYNFRFFLKSLNALQQARVLKKRWALFEEEFSIAVKVKSPRGMRGLFKKYLSTKIIQ